MRLNDVPLHELTAISAGVGGSPADGLRHLGIDLADPDIRRLPLLALALAVGVIQNARQRPSSGDAVPPMPLPSDGR